MDKQPVTSDIFDRIRISPNRPRARARAEEFVADRACEWEGCDQAGTHRAPKGRNNDGQYHHFCLDHVRLYNKSYNYFSGMDDNETRAYQRDALTGHRPTWKMGVNAKAAPEGTAWSDIDPRQAARARAEARMRGRGRGGEARARAPKLKQLEARAFDTLGLPHNARGPEVKTRYKNLVKRHHPDANGGDRSSEDRLREIINAYSLLKKAGFC
ncbi:MAG: molecular chaperone DnaJ [Rhodobacteraceae bacterium]|nr:molecular chaperone DnaJ [Paracoccaceae bacterium]